MSDTHERPPRARVISQRQHGLSVCTCGAGHDESDDDDAAYAQSDYRWRSPAVDGMPLAEVQRNIADAASRTPVKVPPAPRSVVSSADGYDSFENTSNKKKRKIPLSSGGPSPHASSLSADLAHMGISPRDGSDDVDGLDAGKIRSRHNHHEQYPGSGVTLTTQSRPRQNRHNNKSDQRAMGAALAAARATDDETAYTSQLSASSRGGNWTGQGKQFKSDGISLVHSIQPHITNLSLLEDAQDFDENGSHPEHHSSTGQVNGDTSARRLPVSSPKTQFTFTCQGEESSNVVWPLQHTIPPRIPDGPPSRSGRYRPTGHHHPQTAHGQHQHSNHSHNGGSATPLDRPPPSNHHQYDNSMPPPRPRRRRRPSKEYALAAQHRAIAQEYTNYHHKTSKDSMWICEFCEYEDIFGCPPAALIRLYEIKDRAERQRINERRRLLEKAKMKNRKGKKGVKNGKGHDAAHASPLDPGAIGDLPLPPDPLLADDGYYDDYADDGYDPMNPHIGLDESRVDEELRVREEQYRKLASGSSRDIVTPNETKQNAKAAAAPSSSASASAHAPAARA